jgi:hypothetical protein
MHSGFYDFGVDPEEERWEKEDHLEAQHRMMQELLNLWVHDSDLDPGRIVRSAAEESESESDDRSDDDASVAVAAFAKRSGSPSLPTLRVLDAGCGVGGSSRFLYRSLREVRPPPLPMLALSLPAHPALSPCSARFCFQ